MSEADPTLKRTDTVIDPPDRSDRPHRLHGAIGALLELALSPPTGVSLFIKGGEDFRGKRETTPERDGEDQNGGS